MIKKCIQRLLSLVLVISILLPAITVSVLATDLSGNLDVSGLVTSFTRDSYEVSAKWTANGTTITGEVTGYDGWFYDEDGKSTLTLKNDLGADAVLKFTLVPKELNGGSVNVNGTPVSTPKAFSFDLPNGKSITVKMTSPYDKTSTIELTGLMLTPATAKVAVTFLPPDEGGSYTVDGETITSEKKYENDASKKYAVSAKPASGYQFLGWYSVGEGKNLPDEATAELTFDSSKTIKPVFVDASLGIFSVSGINFNDLNAADAYASLNGNKIVLISSGILPAGNYTISAGNSLLIPFDSSNTISLSAPEPTTDAQSYSEFRKLTMAPGASINVVGSICVNSKQLSSTPNAGNPTGPYGRIDMQKGSSITVNSGGALYAWGFITGAGSVTANNGANIYECFQIADWRGGTATSKLVGNKKKVFPVSQYYVQNIEAPLTMQYGATETTYGTVTATGVGTKGVFIPFVGVSGSSSLFEMSSGSTLDRSYDPASDRTTYDAYGNVSVQSIQLSVAGYDLDSAKYIMPINSNLVLNIKSGTTTTAKDIELLAGVQMSVAEGATLEIGSGASMYVYDRTEWLRPGATTVGSNTGYCGPSKVGVAPAVYSPTRSKAGTRGYDSLTGATIDVNGTLRISGALYTTSSGADIKSSQGTGSVEFINEAPKDATVYQVDTQAGGIFASTSYANISVSPAQLHNGDGSYTTTADAVSGDVYHYCSNCDKWYKVGNHHLVNLYVNDSETAVVQCTDGTSVSFENIENPALDETTYEPAAEASYDSATKTLTVSELNAETTTVHVYTARAEVVTVDSEGMSSSKAYSTIQKAIDNCTDGSYIRMITDSTEARLELTGNVYLDLAGKTVTLKEALSDNGKLYGMDSSVTDYTGTPAGKLTYTGGTVSTLTENSPTGEYYVAIPNEDGSVSFHRYNIFVSGYRFELDGDYKDANGEEHPLGALIFQATLKGNNAVVGYMADVSEENNIYPFGFTLNGVPLQGTKTGDNSSWNAATKQFEAYWRGYVTKDNIATDHTAQAWVTFKDEKTKQSVAVKLSYLEALLNAADENNTAGINAFLTKLGRTEQVPVTTTN